MYKPQMQKKRCKVATLIYRKTNTGHTGLVILEQFLAIYRIPTKLNIVRRMHAQKLVTTESVTTMEISWKNAENPDSKEPLPGSVARRVEDKTGSARKFCFVSSEFRNT